MGEQGQRHKKIEDNPPLSEPRAKLAGGKILTFGVSWEVSVIASFVAPGVFQSEELRLLPRPNQFGSNPVFLLLE